MATVCHFPRFRFLFLFDHHTQQQPRQGCYALYHPPRKHFRLRASSIKKSRKVKSNAELCNDIREFVAAVGLPQDHVPTMKEFTEHGRNDLANIVRRRGYKVIREFLATSRETDLGEEENKDEQKEGQDVNVKDVVGEFPSSTEEVVPSAVVSIVDYHSSSSNIDPVLSSDDHSSAPIGFSTELSLEEKVANFMQRGDLDVVEDNAYGTSNESGTEESKEYILSEDAEEVQVRTPTSEHTENALNGGNSGMTSNGRALISTQVVPSATANDSPRNDSLSADGLGTQVNNDLDSETRKRETQVEISKLKNMLHQKEFELSRMKKQIEKEKLALSVLQIKAESEISKAQKIISEKDAELLAAEETLSGLVEVEVQYCGEGETVEVAGSFNGWHHWIKMDLQPSSSITESSGTRKSRCWSTMLWLYPGVYEIKFVVDGHWKLDPKKESVTRGHISNNILHVNG